MKDVFRLCSWSVSWLPLADIRNDNGAAPQYLATLRALKVAEKGRRQRVPWI